MKRIILAGGSGFLGRELAAFFSKQSWKVVILTRHPVSAHHGVREVHWDAKTLGAWAKEIDGSVAVINFTGKSVDCRYTTRNRNEIIRSRVESTKVIGEAISQCAHPPGLWLNASTATIYKHTFGEPWNETGQIGSTPEAHDAFSVEVAVAWEKAFTGAHTPSTRKVALRTTLVLGHARNSVFPVLHRLTRCGLGGKMGSGDQYVSWIHVRDFCRSIDFLIRHKEIQGIVNLAAPGPVPNQEMMKMLRKVCDVPIGFPSPKWLLEIGAFFLRTETELILKSRRVIPGRLLDAGFTFDFPVLTSAFEDLAPRPNKSDP